MSIRLSNAKVSRRAVLEAYSRRAHLVFPAHRFWFWRACRAAAGTRIIVLTGVCFAPRSRMDGSSASGHGKRIHTRAGA